MALPDFINVVWDPLKTPLGLAGGALVTRLWQRYLNRLAVFRWASTYTHIAIAGATPAFGRIDVTWNGTPVTNLQFCNIELENESGRDFTDVEMKFWFQDGTRIHGQGTLQGTAQFFPYTQDFQRRVNAVLPPPAPPPPQDEMDALFGRREYRIPVFNRGTKFGITFLVHPGTNAQPILEVYCDHAGVRLSPRPERQMFWGVVQNHAALVGLVAAVVVSFSITAVTDSTAVIATAAFVAAALAAEIGAGLIHLKRLVGRAIG